MPVVIDTTGKIYDLLGQVLAGQQAAAQAMGLILTYQEKIMATEAEVQAAADAIKASVDDLKVKQAAADAAISAILAWVQSHPGQSLPDSLLDELKQAQQDIGGIASDVETQTGNLTSGTPTS